MGPGRTNLPGTEYHDNANSPHFSSTRWILNDDVNDGDDDDDDNNDDYDDGNDDDGDGNDGDNNDDNVN